MSNAPQTISLVKEKSNQARVFSLGIGASASRHLVKGIARAGEGTAVFATEREDLRTKVIGQLKNALQPAMSNITIAWDETPSSHAMDVAEPVEVETKKTLLGYMKPKKTKKKNTDKKSKTVINHELFGQVPKTIPPLFDGTRLLVYYIYQRESKVPQKLTVTGESPDGPLSVDIEIKDSNVLEGEKFVRKLAARKKIQELQEQPSHANYWPGDSSDSDSDSDVDDKKESTDTKRAIIQLGIENGLASKYTSFVGVAQKTKNVLSDKPMMTREIKNQVPSGFGSPFGMQNYSKRNAAKKCGGAVRVCGSAGAMRKGKKKCAGKLRSSKQSSYRGKYVKHNLELHPLKKRYNCQNLV